MHIHQDVTINAPARAVYDLLLDGKLFGEMTGGREAQISSEIGGASSLFGGAISALNVELVPGKRVVQAWRSNDWPEGVYSIVRFELTADGKATKLSFDQGGHPDAATEMLATGWHQMYWEPMAKMLAG